METYFVRTFGCQMNKHDSERIAGMLEAEGLVPAADPESADVIVFNTCCVREHADERLRGQVASLKSTKNGRPDVLIAVGGCLAQRDRERLLLQLPHVDVVFGPHTLEKLPGLLHAAEESRRPQVGIAEATDTFAGDLPSRRERPWHAWIPVTVGCDNFCSYCIVPYVRGGERSRPIHDIAEEVRSLVADGVVEVTLLGQNVNSYGRDLYGEPRFAEVLSLVAASGVEWVRFATSHPKDLSAEIVEVLRDDPHVCRQLHLPVQSGSDEVLRRMNRRYTADHYLGLVERLHAEIPGLALSTDIIVGFPGETESDFEATMDLVRRVGYDQAFTFLYSPREGTPAASMAADSVPREVAQERFERLVQAVQSSAYEKNVRLEGTVQRVLVEGASKRDDSVLLGRNEGNKVVHAPLPANVTAEGLAGTFVEVDVQEAHTWFLSGRLVSASGLKG